MDPSEADAAKEPHDQRKDKPVREYSEGQARGCSKQCTADIKSATVPAISSGGQERHCDGVAGKIYTADPAGFSGTERPGGGDLMQRRRERHLRGKVRHQAE